GELLLRGVQLRGDRLGVQGQARARLRGRDAGGGAQQQLRAHLLLERGQVLGYGRLGPAQLARARADRAVAHDGPEDEKPAGVHGCHGIRQWQAWLMTSPTAFWAVRRERAQGPARRRRTSLSKGGRIES